MIFFFLIETAHRISCEYFIFSFWNRLLIRSEWLKSLYIFEGLQLILEWKREANIPISLFFFWSVFISNDGMNVLSNISRTQYDCVLHINMLQESRLKRQIRVYVLESDLRFLFFFQNLSVTRRKIYWYFKETLGNRLEKQLCRSIRKRIELFVVSSVNSSLYFFSPRS